MPVFLIAVFVLFVGISAKHHHAKPAAEPAISLSSSERAVLVADSTKLICGRYLPASTSLHVICLSNDLLSDDLITSLRGRGFALRSEQNADGKNAIISVQPVGSEAILLRLSVSKDWEADRLYHRDSSGVTPETNFSVRNDGDS
jgi:hypothetical protein